MAQPRSPREAIVSPRETWLLVGSRYALTWPVFVFYLFPQSLAITLLATSSPGAATDGEWAIISVVSWTATIGTLLLFRFTVLPNRPREARPLLTLLAFFCAGIVRALSFEFTQNALGVVTRETTLMRFVSGTSSVMMIFCFLAVLISARYEFRAAVLKLLAEREHLSRLRAEALSRAHEHKRVLVTKAQAAIAPALDSIASALSAAQDQATLARISASMIQTVNELVRPLSVRMAQSLSVVPTEPSDESPRGYIGVRPRKPTQIGRLILPAGFTIFVVLLTFVSLLFLVVPSELLETLAIMAVGLFALLWVGRWSLRRLALTPVLGGVVYVLLHGAVAVLVVGGVIAFTTTIGIDLLAGWVVLVMALATVAYRYQVIQIAQREALKELESVNEEIEIVTSAIRQQTKIDASRVANILHGPIQSALYASAIRLNQATTVDAALTGDVIAELTAAMTRLTDDTTTSPTVQEFVAEIRRVWGNGVLVTLNEDEESRAALAMNPSARGCVIEVIREGVNNAIKHAHATQVSVDVFSVETQLIDVTVRNTGTALTPPAIEGYGSTLLGDLTHSWTLTSTYNTTTLWASVAVAPFDVTDRDDSL
jgi:hypothetical protein